MSRATAGVKYRKDFTQDFMNKLAAWKKGKNPWVSIDRPKENATVDRAKLHTRVRANTLWGDPRGKIHIEREET